MGGRSTVQEMSVVAELVEPGGSAGVPAKAVRVALCECGPADRVGERHRLPCETGETGDWDRLDLLPQRVEGVCQSVGGSGSKLGEKRRELAGNVVLCHLKPPAGRGAALGRELLVLRNSPVRRFYIRPSWRRVYIAVGESVRQAAWDGERTPPRLGLPLGRQPGRDGATTSGRSTLTRSRLGDVDRRFCERVSERRLPAAWPDGDGAAGNWARAAIGVEPATHSH